MKPLLIIGLAFSLAACSDSKQREATVNKDKELSPLSEHPSQADVKKPKERHSFQTPTQKMSQIGKVMILRLLNYQILPHRVQTLITFLIVKAITPSTQMTL